MMTPDAFAPPHAPVNLDLTTVPASVAVALRMCEDGRLALQEAADVADAKQLLDRCAVLEHAVRVGALGRESAIAASTLRVRAERRVGELLQRQAKHRGGRPRRDDNPDRLPATLRALGLSKDASRHYQQLAAMPEPVFEQALEELAGVAGGGRVTRRAVLRQAEAQSARTREEASRGVDQFLRACDLVHKRVTPALEAICLGHVPAPPLTDADAMEPRPTLVPLRQAREAIAEVEAALLEVLHAQQRD